MGCLCFINVCLAEGRECVSPAGRLTIATFTCTVVVRKLEVSDRRSFETTTH